MKRTLFALLFLVGIPAWAQQNNSTDFLFDITQGRIENKAYAAATLDTTNTIDVTKFSSVHVAIQSKDSASIYVNYQTSLDGVTWGVSTVKDSLSTASNAGDVKTIDFTATVGGAPFVRFIISQNVFRLGYSSATYSAVVTRKE